MIHEGVRPHNTAGAARPFGNARRMRNDPMM
jgi:hypothetical protein